MDNSKEEIFPNSTIHHPNEIMYSEAVRFILGSLALLTSIITVAGNILVLVSFLVERALRSSTNFAIASLAVTDLLIGGVSMNLYTVSLLWNNWYLGEILCDLWLSLDFTLCLSSQYTVLFITVDRYCSVTMPARYRNWRTDCRVKLIVAATWVVPGCLFFPIILGWPYISRVIQPQHRADPRNPYNCQPEFLTWPNFTAVLTVSYFWVTLLVMSALYACIYRVALNLQRTSEAKRRRTTFVISAAAGGGPLNASSQCNMQIPLLAHKTPSNSSPEQDEVSSRYLKEEPWEAMMELSNSTQFIESPRIAEVLISAHPFDLPISQPSSPVWVKRKQETLSRRSSSSEEGTTPLSLNEHIARLNFGCILSSESVQEETPTTKGSTFWQFVHRWKSLQTMRAFHNKSCKHERDKTENRAFKALRTISLIMGAFVVCWTPYHVLVLVQGYCTTCVPDELYNLSYWLCYLNSPINPFCYALANKQFKNTFIRLLKGHCHRT